MKADPSPDGNAEGSHFEVLHPNAAVLRITVSLNAEIGKNLYYNFFEQIDKPTDGEVSLSQMNDGIDDQLPGAMVGDISSSFNSLNFYSLRGQLFSVGQNVVLAATPTQGYDRFVLHQQ
jgi:hypothetical protein